MKNDISIQYKKEMKEKEITYQNDFLEYYHLKD